MSEAAHVILAANDAYYLGLLVTSASLARRARKDIPLVFHVFDGGISDEHFVEYGERVTEVHELVSIDRIKMNDSLFLKCPDFRGNKMTYARLLAPDLLTDVDLAVYCDVDVLWHADIEDLIGLCSGEDVSIWSVHADLSEGADESFKRQGWCIDPERYFNAGVLVMNFEQMRQERFLDKIMSVFARFPNIELPDQNALNILYSASDRLRVLDAAWNVRTYAAKNREEIRSAKVLHYVAAAPWNRGLWAYPFSPGSMQWFKELAMIEGVGVLRCAGRTLTWRRLLPKLLLTAASRTPVLSRVLRMIGRG